MSKLLTMLCAFALLISPISMDAKKKETKKIVPQMANYPSANIDEFRMHGGDVVLKSRVIMPDSVTKYASKEKTMAILKQFSARMNCRGASIIKEDYIVNKQDNHSLEFNDECAIDMTIHVPYPMFVYVMPYEEVYMCPGDTVEMTLDMTKPMNKGFVRFDGTGISGEINRLMPEITKNYINHPSFPMPRLKDESQIDTLMAWRNMLIASMDSMVEKMNAGLPELQNCSPLASDIIRTYILNDYFAEIFEPHSIANNWYKTWKEYYVFWSKYFDFLAPREKYLLDNPLMMISSNWALFNRLEFSTFLPINPRREYIYPVNYNDTLTAAKDSITPRQNLARGLQKISDELHLSKADFLQQVCMIRYVFGKRRSENSETTAERFAAMMPYITNPELARQATLAYRDYVKEHDAQVADNKPMTEGDSIFQRIIAPYAGNVLVLDFWEMSCGPCRAGMLGDRNTVEQYKDKPIKFLYITDSDPKESEEWMKESNIHGEHIFISKSEWSKMMEKFNFSAIPFHAIVDKKGKIRKYGLSLEKLVE